MKVMKWLRASGVRNVNVLMDGHFYSELMNNCTGDEMKFSPSYSIYPVFNRSIFHPKIWLFLGEQEGLVIIGSGNLTNGGNGNNEELWGAFHFDIKSKENLEIFSSIWNYVQGITKDFKGIVSEKTSKWIFEQSKWLDELPATALGNLYKSNKSSIALLANTKTSTIWEQLAKLLEGEIVTEITTISPFYDAHGQIIDALMHLYPKAHCNVIVDTSGLIPHKFVLNKRVSFYEWNNVGISEDDVTRLHAKALLFKTTTNMEILLFGSANLTPEGFGLYGSKQANAEASLLIKKEAANFLSQLGIKLSESKKVKLADLEVVQKPSIFQTVLKHNHHPLKILSAEITYEQLTIYSTGSTQACLVNMYDTANQFVSAIKIELYSTELSIKVQEPQRCRYVQFFSVDGKSPISNKIIVADYFLLIKTHPNPKTEDIERIYNEIQNGELTRVLDLLHYAIIDDTEDEEENIFQRSTGRQVEEDKRQPKQLYDLSTYKPIHHAFSERNLLFSSPSLRVLDVIKFVHSREFQVKSEADLRVDEQEQDLSNIAGNEKDEVPQERNLTLSVLNSERKKLCNYLFNLYAYFNCILYTTKDCEEDAIRRKHLIDRNKDYKVTITDLTKYLIGIELLLEFGDKTAKYINGEKQQSFQYLPMSSSEEYFEVNNVKGFCLNTVGDFLMLMRRGVKSYEFEYTIKRVVQLKYEALISTVVCLLNNKWVEDELDYFKTLLLNSLHYLGCNKHDEFKQQYDTLLKDVESRCLLLKSVPPFFEENFRFFKTKIIKGYVTTLQKRETQQFDATAQKGNVIYSSLVGYCHVQSISKNNEFSLIRPGFMWDDNYGDFIRHRADGVYSPIKLPSFISVNF
jgi:HKD family nuclease